MVILVKFWHALKDAIADFDLKDALAKNEEAQRKYDIAQRKYEATQKKILNQLEMLVAQKQSIEETTGESLKAFRARIIQEQREQLYTVITQALDHAIADFDGITMQYNALEAARCMENESDSEEDIEDVLKAVRVIETENRYE
ncbi:uncharacterized protein KRP23_1895 [Phytophthora ramorum]|uniref:uncharacterized protein n=1 Tax=Phytophthora ramorum TaxID=164328 RepID=UPI0030A66C22|nr:hypothetical protein KRP23_1895 [Phytophthora ramorum]